jgi:hypothetical protein
MDALQITLTVLIFSSVIVVPIIWAYLNRRNPDAGKEQTSSVRESMPWKDTPEYRYGEELLEVLRIWKKPRDTNHENQ